ncbi:hypothetical protein B0H14DRAFT_2623224 [Mycena olivaceomarginata]|nr:hypothetical protein B0H14DRAFT_2623224 [Mycena olivaceomarginata]
MTTFWLGIYIEQMVVHCGCLKRLGSLRWLASEWSKWTCSPETTMGASERELWVQPSPSRHFISGLWVPSPGSFYFKCSSRWSPADDKHRSSWDQLRNNCRHSPMSVEAAPEIPRCHGQWFWVGRPGKPESDGGMQRKVVGTN